MIVLTFSTVCPCVVDRSHVVCNSFTLVNSRTDTRCLCTASFFLHDPPPRRYLKKVLELEPVYDEIGELLDRFATLKGTRIRVVMDTPLWSMIVNSLSIGSHACNFCMR